MIRPFIALFRQGLTDSEILYKILEARPNIKESTAKFYLAAAKTSFREEYVIDRKFNIAQHVRRYDIDIAKLSAYEPKTSSYAKSVFEKTQANLDMIRLLQQKEKVLGFHRPTTAVKIKNNLTINLPVTKRNFSFEGLTMEEKVEFYHLITKAKVLESEKLSLLPNQKAQARLAAQAQGEGTVDLAHDQYQILNVEQITERSEESKVVEEVKPMIGPNNIVDARPPAPKRRGALSNPTLDNIRQQILNKINKTNE